jgi:hypothetical protein
MREPTTVQTDLGVFVVSASTPLSGRLYSKGDVRIDGRVYHIDTRWQLRGADRALVIDPLGISSIGTWAQGVRGHWWITARQAISTALAPHILALVEGGNHGSDAG